MLRTPSRVRSVFNKKGAKQEAELPKTAPTTPEDEDPGVTVMTQEIDPTTLSTHVLQQIVGKKNPSSPSVGDHRSYSSQSGGKHREEKKEDDSPVESEPSPDDVVSKTLSYFDDICKMQPVDENGEGFDEKPKPYLLLNHIAGFDDGTTTSPSLPSETTANESSAPYSKGETTTTAPNQPLKRTSTAHNHENFEVVLDPASVLKDSSQKQKRFLPFKKKSESPAARDEEAELKESFDRLLNGTEKLDKAERSRARKMTSKSRAVSNDEPKEEDPNVLEDLNDILCGTGDDEKTASEKNVSAITTEDEENIQQLQNMVPVKTVVAKKKGKSIGQRLKKFKNTAFMIGRKGSKKTKASGQGKAADKPAISPEEVTLNVDPNGVPLKPKQTWKSVVDPNTGRTYYYHRKTRETTWVKPEALTRYEIAFQKWIDYRVAMQAKEAAEQKVADESKPEEKATTPAAESEPEPVEEKSPAVEKEARAPIVSAPSSQPRGIKAKPIETVVKEPQTIKEEEPFDEEAPFDVAGPKDNAEGLLFLPKSPPRFGRTITHASKASARSSLTERTEKIRNTGKASFNPISETSSSYRVPSRVPVIRERQLVVEDLTESRLSAESYETSRGRRGRIVRGRARDLEPAPETYDGDMDTDDHGASGYDNDTYGTDSVSALSENDADFLSRKDNFDQARRRALDAAIESEDWNLAAALSDGMRAGNAPRGGFEKSTGSWNQSELDKFIANNDWTAVKNYIAKMREQSKQELAKAPPANKKIGSRSQMQHSTEEYMSESSSSGSESSFDDATSASESEM